jgi:hypothetical protein
MPGAPTPGKKQVFSTPKLYHNEVFDLSKRSTELSIDSNDMSIQQQIEPGKVLIVVLDGHQGKAKVFEAVEHGLTIIETAKGCQMERTYLSH